MNFKEELKEKISAIDEELEKYLPLELGSSKVLYEAMRYSVFAGGKRLRPLLLLGAAECFGSYEKTAMPFACAVELIHTYSLIHDDLPAMDNDDYRRGKLTNHKVFGENIAILAGDGLLSYAFDMMTEACIKDTRLLPAMKEISFGAGVFGMVSGQTVDVISEGTKISPETLLYIHKNKTAAMIIAALTAGGICAAADEKSILTLRLLGEKIGLAFQIQDDILDVEGTKETLGKPINSDLKNKKITYVTLYGLEESKKLVKKAFDEAGELLQSVSENTGFLSRLIEYTKNRTY